MDNGTPVENVVQGLADARALIADPVNWLQDINAVDSVNGEIDPTDPEACKFCANGAVMRAFNFSVNHAVDDNNYRLYHLYYAATNYLNAAAITLFPQYAGDVAPAVVVNDGKQHKDVLAVFDKALELARKDKNEQ